MGIEIGPPCSNIKKSMTPAFYPDLCIKGILIKIC